MTDFSGTVDESDTTVSAGGYTAKFFGPEGRKSEEILQKTEGGAPRAGSYTTNAAVSGSSGLRIQSFATVGTAQSQAPEARALSRNSVRDICVARSFLLSNAPRYRNID